MKDYPEYVKVKDKIYKINTDFRIAIECNKIAEDSTIGDFERALAIIFILFGEEAINDLDSCDIFLKLARKYLSCGKEIDDNNQEPDMDYIEDEEYIKSSFKYDYQYNPYEMEYLHWYTFFNDLNNLSNSELGNCCVLNRIRNLRTYDTREIKDRKQKEKIEKAKKQVALKKKRIVHLTKPQEESMNNLNKMLGL